MWVCTGVRWQETPGQERASSKRSGAGQARHRGHGADIEIWRWHNVFREQHTDQLGQEAGGEDHKEVVVKSWSLTWLTKGTKEEGYQRRVEPRDEEQGLKEEATGRATPSTKPRPARRREPGRLACCLWGGGYVGRALCLQREAGIVGFCFV